VFKAVFSFPTSSVDYGLAIEKGSAVMNSINSDGTANANILREDFEGQSLSPTTGLKTVDHGQSIIIVGAGAFGSSLALELVTNYSHK
jgi:hypothetical protein